MKISDLRKQFGNLTENLTDEQIRDLYAEETLSAYKEKFKGDEARARRAIDRDLGYDAGDNFGRGLRRGFIDVGGSIDAAQALGSDLIARGLDRVGLPGGDRLRQVRDSNIKEYTDAQQRSMWQSRRVDDVDNIGEDPTAWVAQGAGVVAANVLPSVLTGGLGSLGARYIAGKAAGKLVKDEARRQAIKSTATKAGAVGGSFVGNTAMEAGGIYGENAQEGRYEPGRALGYGAAAGALDTLSEALPFLAPATKGGLTRRVLGTAVRGAMGEAATETAQTAIERAGTYKDLLSDDAFKEYRNAAALGALGGGSLGTVGGAYSYATRNPAQENPNVADPEFLGGTPPAPPAPDDGGLELAPLPQGGLRPPGPASYEGGIDWDPNAAEDVRRFDDPFNRGGVVPGDIQAPDLGPTLPGAAPVDLLNPITQTFDPRAPQDQQVDLAPPPYASRVLGLPRSVPENWATDDPGEPMALGRVNAADQPVGGEPSTFIAAPDGTVFADPGNLQTLDDPNAEFIRRAAEQKQKEAQEAEARKDEIRKVAQRRQAADKEAGEVGLQGSKQRELYFDLKEAQDDGRITEAEFLENAKLLAANKLGAVRNWLDTKKAQPKPEAAAAPAPAREAPPATKVSTAEDVEQVLSRNNEVITSAENVREIPDVSPQRLKTLTPEQLADTAESARLYNNDVEQRFVTEQFGEEAGRKFAAMPRRRKDAWLQENLTVEQDDVLQGRYVDDARASEFASAANAFDTESPQAMGRSIANIAKKADDPGFADSPEALTLRNAFLYAAQQGWNPDDVIGGMRTRANELAGADAPELFSRLFKDAQKQVGASSRPQQKQLGAAVQPPAPAPVAEAPAPAVETEAPVVGLPNPNAQVKRKGRVIATPKQLGAAVQPPAPAPAPAATEPAKPKSRVVAPGTMAKLRGEKVEPKETNNVSVADVPGTAPGASGAVGGADAGGSVAAPGPVAPVAGSGDSRAGGTDAAGGQAGDVRGAGDAGRGRRQSALDAEIKASSKLKDVEPDPEGPKFDNDGDFEEWAREQIGGDDAMWKAYDRYKLGGSLRSLGQELGVTGQTVKNYHDAIKARLDKLAVVHRMDGARAPAARKGAEFTPQDEESLVRGYLIGQSNGKDVSRENVNLALSRLRALPADRRLAMLRQMRAEQNSVVDDVRGRSDVRDELDDEVTFDPQGEAEAAARAEADFREKQEQAAEEDRLQGVGSGKTRATADSASDTDAASAAEYDEDGPGRSGAEVDGSTQNSNRRTSGAAVEGLDEETRREYLRELKPQERKLRAEWEKFTNGFAPISARRNWDSLSVQEKHDFMSGGGNRASFMSVMFLKSGGVKPSGNLTTKDRKSAAEYLKGETPAQRAALVGDAVASAGLTPEEVATLEAQVGAKKGTPEFAENLGRSLISATETGVSALPKNIREPIQKVGRALFKRSQDTGGGMGAAKVREAAKRLANRGQVKVNVADNVDGLPASIREDMSADERAEARALYDRETDQVWVVGDRIENEQALAEAIAHEAFHRGIAKLPGGDAALMRLAASNKKLRDAARAQREQFGYEGAVAVEEALATMSETDMRAMTGWDKFVQFVREAMQRLGRALGVSQNLVTDGEIAALIKAVREAGMSADMEVSGQDNQTVRLSRVKANNALRDAIAKRTPPAARDSMSRITEALKRSSPALLTNFQLAEQFGAKLPSLKKFVEGQQLMTQDRMRQAQPVHDLAVEWSSFRTKNPRAEQELGNLMLNATLAEIHPDTNDGPGVGVNKHVPASKQAQYAKLKAQYDKLPPDAKKLYQDAKTILQDQWAERRRAFMERLDTVYGSAVQNADGDVDRLAEIQKQGEELRKKYDEAMGQLKGPYFPLLRFGDFVAIGRSPELARLHDELQQAKGEAAAKLRDRIAEMSKDPRHYVVSSHESRSEMQRALEGYAKGGMEVEEKLGDLHEHHMNMLGSKDYASIQQMQDSIAKELGGKSDEAQAIGDALTKMMMESLPQFHALRREAARKGIAGASTDMLRSFAMAGMQNAFYNSRLAHAGRQADMLNALKIDAKNNIDLSYIHQEMQKRMSLDLQYKETPIQDFIGSLSWVYHLGVSPTYLAMNMTQPYMTTAPVLAGKFGPGAVKAVARGSADALKILKKARFGENGKWDPWTSVDVDNFRADEYAKAPANVKREIDGERAMLRTLVDRGIVDIGAQQELSMFANDGNQRLAKFMRYMGWATQQVEVVNRLSTVLAAYRLAVRDPKAAGMDPVDYAYKTAMETQLDYSAEGNARVMREGGPVPFAKLIFQFRRFQQGMLYLLGSNLKRVYQGKERKEAALTLAYLTTVTGAVAGTLGLPFMGVAMAAANALSDDDDPEGDARTRWRNMLTDMFGAQAADVLALGLPALWGANMSQRMGLGDVASPFPMAKFDQARTGNQAVGELLVNVFGPSAGMAGKFWEAHEHFGAGDWQKGFEKIVPKFLADISRGIRQQTQGMTDGKGEEILSPDEISMWNSVMRALGTGSVQESNYYEATAAIQGTNRAINETKNTLARQYKAAFMRGDDTSSIEARIDKFNERMPDERMIDEKDIARWEKDAKRAEMMRGESGVKYDPRTSKGIEDLARFAGD